MAETPERCEEDTDPLDLDVAGTDPMEFIEALLARDSGLETPVEAYFRGLVLELLIRAPRKGRDEDYRKAADCCERLAALAAAR